MNKLTNIRLRISMARFENGISQPRCEVISFQKSDLLIWKCFQGLLLRTGVKVKNLWSLIHHNAREFEKSSVSCITISYSWIDYPAIIFDSNHEFFTKCGIGGHKSRMESSLVIFRCSCSKCKSNKACTLIKCS